MNEAAYRWLAEQIETEYGRAHAKRWQESLRWIEELLTPGCRVLDLGGPNPFADCLKQFWPQVFVAGTTDDLRYEFFDCPQGGYDLVLCLEVLEHLKDQETAEPRQRERFTGSGIRHCLAEALRVTRPGGHLLLTTPNLTSWYGLNRILQHAHPHLCEGHVREFTAAEARHWVERCGWRVQRWETVDVWNQHWMEPERVALLRQAAALAGASELVPDQRGDDTFILARKPLPPNP